MNDRTSPDSGNWSQVYGGVEGASLRPFGVHWLDSALEETLLPGTPWEQVRFYIPTFEIHSYLYF